MQTLLALFEQWAGERCIESHCLSGGGSNRHYYRLRSASRQCVGAIGESVRENEAFFTISRHLYDKGIPVPQIYAIDPTRRCYLQQDLGDETLYLHLFEKKRQGGGFDAEMLSLYKPALADLATIQIAGRDLDFSVAFPRAEFDRRAMLWDLNYFKYYFLKLAYIPFDEERLENDFNNFIDFLLQADTSFFVYRDFQSRNIMIHDGTLYYIDYQGGRRGAAQYDAASLLYSAKSDIPQPARTELLQYYLDKLLGRSNPAPTPLQPTPFDKATWYAHFWGYVMIRIMQAMGAYGYRGYFERKPYFLESIPLAISNLRWVVENHPLPVDLPELQRVWRAIVDRAPTSPVLPSSLTVRVGSFSYKQGIPDDPSGNGGGFIFDCRALPNPGRYPEYRQYTGKDNPVIEFLAKEPSVAAFLSNAKQLVAQSVDKYLERHFTHLEVHFGCTGGQHRSVYCAEQLSDWLRSNYPDTIVETVHRERPLPMP